MQGYALMLTLSNRADRAPLIHEPNIWYENVVVGGPLIDILDPTESEEMGKPLLDYHQTHFRYLKGPI